MTSLHTGSWQHTGVGDRRSQRLLLGALLALCLAYALMQSAVLPALPAFQRDFETTPAWATWVVTSFTLVSVVATLLLGSIAGRLGYRRVLLCTVAVFGVSTLLGALAWNIAILILLRAIQGVGGAVFPLAFALVGTRFPANRRATAIGWLSAMYGVGAAVGFPLSGWLLDTVGWPSLFLVGGVIVLAGGAGVAFSLPRDPAGTAAEDSKPPDRTSAVLMSVGLSLLLLSMTVPTEVGWTTAPAILLYAATAAVLWGWIRRERRILNPLIDLRLLKRRIVAVPNIVSALTGLVMYAAFILVVQYAGTTYGMPSVVASQVGYGIGASPSTTGLMMVPAALAIMIAGPLTGRLIHWRVTHRRLLTTAMVLATVGSMMLVLWNQTIPALVVGMCVLALGAGSSFASMPALLVDRVAAEESSAVLSVNVVVRQFGVVAGAQLSAAVLTTATIPGTGVPSKSAYELLFLGAAVMAGVGVLVATALPGGDGGQ